MNFSTNWLHGTKSQRRKILNRLAIERDYKTAHNYIDLVRAGHQGVYASMGPHYSYAIFGRDSIEVAEDLMSSHKTLVRDIIFTLARLQGVKNDSLSEEEPGKIHHEYRSLYFDGKTVSKEALAVMHNLQRLWGSIGADDIVYYGSFDTTPMYIRLVCNYAKQYGKSILNETYTDRNAHKKTIHESIRSATDWLIAKIEASSWNLLEYKRINPNGLLNQVWKDSETSYIHLDGKIANAESGIAAVELQGYAYDALTMAAQLESNRSQANRYCALASKIQQATIDKLWMADKHFFAQGLDRDENGATRQIQTLTSNPGLLLSSRLLLDLAEASRQNYCEGIIKTIFSPEFLTDAGIRCRALRHKKFPGFTDYHGTYAVWPKETFDISQGLLQHGYTQLAKQLTNRLVRSVIVAGDFYELFYVEENGNAWYDRADLIKHFSNKPSPHQLAVPEPGQAWVISAFINILSNWDRWLKPAGPFEQQLLQTFRNVNV